MSPQWTKLPAMVVLNNSIKEIMPSIQLPTINVQVTLIPHPNLNDPITTLTGKSVYAFRFSDPSGKLISQCGVSEFFSHYSKRASAHPPVSLDLTAEEVNRVKYLWVEYTEPSAPF